MLHKSNMFGLFPLLLAVVVTLISGRFLGDKVGVLIWVVAPATGICSWALYCFVLRIIGKKLDQKKAKIWQWQNEKRTYQEFNPAQQHVIGKNLFYECVICGNAIPSILKKKTDCACRNISIDVTGRVTIQNLEKVKIFVLDLKPLH